MIISNAQFQAMSDLRRQLQPVRLAQDIRKEFPEQSKQYKPEELGAIIKTCTDTGAKLGINRERDVYRLCRLNFIDPAFINLPYVQKVLYLVLNNTAASAEARLDFIDQQLLSRQSELMTLF